MNVFDVLSNHVNWASQRYAVAAANVANIDTPGFRAKEVVPFEVEVSSTAMRLARSHNAHLSQGGSTVEGTYDSFEQSRVDETHSGNNVSAEHEMKVIGESARAISSSTAIFKMFHRMTMLAAKGQ
jgi:flagellar basal-body rod protein FlgB